MIFEKNCIRSSIAFISKKIFPNFFLNFEIFWTSWKFDGQLQAQIKKWSHKIFICWKGPFNTFKKMFFKILKLGADGFLTRFFDFQFWSVAPPGCVIFFSFQGGSYLQAEISMIWLFFLNHAPQECLTPKILNYGPIGISWSGSLVWAIKLIIHRILLYDHIKKAKNLKAITQYPIIRNGDQRWALECLKNYQFLDTDHFLFSQASTPTFSEPFLKFFQKKKKKKI